MCACMYVGGFKHTWRSGESVWELVLSLKPRGSWGSISLDKKYLGLPILPYSTNLKTITKVIPPLSIYTKSYLQILKIFQDPIISWYLTQSSKYFRILSFLGILITCN